MEGKLEKIAKSTGKATLGLALAAAIYSAQEPANAQVIVSLRCVDSQTGEETRELNPGKDYQVQVLADNRGLNGKETYKFEWDIDNMEQINLVDIPQPNPKYEGYFMNDFFYGDHVMETLLNNVKIEGSVRATKKRVIGGISKRTGPSNANGVIGVYSVRVSDFGNQKIFSLKNVEVLGEPNNSFQPVKIKNLSVATIADINDSNRRPVLLMDQDDENARYEFYGTKMPGKRLVLQSTTNFPNGEWTSVYTNSTPGEPLLYSEPLTFEGNKMYRLMTSD